MLDGIGSLSAWAVIQKNGETLRTRFETRKDMTADADRLRAAAKKFASVEDLMKDRRSLYFQRQASSVSSLAGLMADTALTAVVKGAYALPSQFALLDYDKQKAILAKRVDLDDLKDPKKVAKMIQRYLVKEGDQSSGSVSMVLSLFDSGNDATSNLISLAGRKVSLLA